jgi:DNA-directed RNA polymerase subunit M/transcription elongation factor TFIIS
MATGIRISCPSCQQQMTVPASVQGKKVRCKGCGGVIPVPAAKAVETRTTTAEAAAKKAAQAIPEEEDAQRPYGVTETSLAPRCPHCAYELDPPEARICLHCGYDMVRRQRQASVKTYERTFGDWLVWLGPGILSLIAFIGLIGFCIYFHYYLPDQLFNNWSKNQEAAKGDRFQTVEKTTDESYLALIFHPGIETWIIVFCIWLMWKSGRYAFKRLVLDYLPPEKIKDKG